MTHKEAKVYTVDTHPTSSRTERNVLIRLEPVTGEEEHVGRQQANVNSVVPSVFAESEALQAEFFEFLQYKREREGKGTQNIQYGSRGDGRVTPGMAATPEMTEMGSGKVGSSYKTKEAGCGQQQVGVSLHVGSGVEPPGTRPLGTVEGGAPWREGSTLQQQTDEYAGTKIQLVQQQLQATASGGGRST